MSSPPEIEEIARKLVVEPSVLNWKRISVDMGEAGVCSFYFHPQYLVWRIPHPASAGASTPIRITCLNGNLDDLQLSDEFMADWMARIAHKLAEDVHRGLLASLAFHHHR